MKPMFRRTLLPPSSPHPEDGGNTAFRNVYMASQPRRLWFKSPFPCKSQMWIQNKATWNPYLCVHLMTTQRCDFTVPRFWTDGYVLKQRCETSSYEYSLIFGDRNESSITQTKQKSRRQNYLQKEEKWLLKHLHTTVYEITVKI